VTDLRAIEELTTDELLDAIRDLLRYAGDYRVTLELWASYGCYRVTVSRLSQVIWVNIGKRPGERLRRALKYLRSECERESPKGHAPHGAA
jgi:hypothetical protein